MYNRTILMGRICNDLELKSTPSGVAVLSFRIAVERAYQVKGEEKKTDFFNCVAWREKADFISRFFSKGRMILVEGELQTRQYKDKSGNMQTATEIIIDSARFTGEASESGNRPPEPTEPPPQYAVHTTAKSTAQTTAKTTAKTTADSGPIAEDFAAQVQASDEEYPF